MSAVRWFAALLVATLTAFAAFCEGLEDLRVEKVRRAR